MNFEYLLSEIEIMKTKRFLDNISVADLKIKLDNLFPNLTHGQIIWDSRYHIYRVRQNHNNNFKPYNNICQIGIPPSDKTPFGRANNEFMPVFYGSYEDDLALFESCQNLLPYQKFEPQNFTMGIWKIKENQTLRLVPIIESEIASKNRDDIKKVLKLKNDIMDSKIGDLDLIKYYKIVSTFFADEFSKSEINSKNDYKISAYFSEKMRETNKYSHIKFDGILYPSVAHKFKSDNVVIFPESLNKIEIVKCMETTAYNFNFNEGKLVKAYLAEGKVNEVGEIIWKNL